MVSSIKIPDVGRNIHVVFKDEYNSNRACKYLGKNEEYGKDEQLDGFISQSQKELLIDNNIQFTQLDIEGKEVSKVVEE